MKPIEIYKKKQAEQEKIYSRMSDEGKSRLEGTFLKKINDLQNPPAYLSDYGKSRMKASYDKMVYQGYIQPAPDIRSEMLKNYDWRFVNTVHADPMKLAQNPGQLVTVDKTGKYYLNGKEYTTAGHDFWQWAGLPLPKKDILSKLTGGLFFNDYGFQFNDTKPSKLPGVEYNGGDVTLQSLLQKLMLDVGLTKDAFAGKILDSHNEAQVKSITDLYKNLKSAGVSDEDAAYMVQTGTAGNAKEALIETYNTKQRMRSIYSGVILNNAKQLWDSTLGGLFKGDLSGITAILNALQIYANTKDDFSGASVLKAFIPSLELYFQRNMGFDGRIFFTDTEHPELSDRLLNLMGASAITAGLYSDPRSRGTYYDTMHFPLKEFFKHAAGDAYPDHGIIDGALGLAEWGLTMYLEGKVDLAGAMSNAFGDTMADMMQEEFFDTMGRVEIEDYTKIFNEDVQMYFSNRKVFGTFTRKFLEGKVAFENYFANVIYASHVDDFDESALIKIADAIYDDLSLSAIITHDVKIINSIKSDIDEYTKVSNYIAGMPVFTPVMFLTKLAKGPATRYFANKFRGAVKDFEDNLGKKLDPDSFKENLRIARKYDRVLRILKGTEDTEELFRGIELNMIDNELHSYAKTIYHHLDEIGNILLNSDSSSNAYIQIIRFLNDNGLEYDNLTDYFNNIKSIIYGSQKGIFKYLDYDTILRLQTLSEFDKIGFDNLQKNNIYNAFLAFIQDSSRSFNLGNMIQNGGNDIHFYSFDPNIEVPEGKVLRLVKKGKAAYKFYDSIKSSTKITDDFQEVEVGLIPNMQSEVMGMKYLDVFLDETLPKRPESLSKERFSKIISEAERYINLMNYSGNNANNYLRILNQAEDTQARIGRMVDKVQRFMEKHYSRCEADLEGMALAKDILRGDKNTKELQQKFWDLMKISEQNVAFWSSVKIDDSYTALSASTKGQLEAMVTDIIDRANEINRYLNEDVLLTPGKSIEDAKDMYIQMEDVIKNHPDGPEAGILQAQQILEDYRAYLEDFRSEYSLTKSSHDSTDAEFVQTKKGRWIRNADKRGPGDRSQISPLKSFIIAKVQSESSEAFDAYFDLVNEFRHGLNKFVYKVRKDKGLDFRGRDVNASKVVDKNPTVGPKLQAIIDAVVQDKERFRGLDNVVDFGKKLADVYNTNANCRSIYTILSEENIPESMRDFTEDILNYLDPELHGKGSLYQFLDWDLGEHWTDQTGFDNTGFDSLAESTIATLKKSPYDMSRAIEDVEAMMETYHTNKGMCKLYFMDYIDCINGKHDETVNALVQEALFAVNNLEVEPSKLDLQALLKDFFASDEFNPDEVMAEELKSFSSDLGKFNYYIGIKNKIPLSLKFEQGAQVQDINRAFDMIDEAIESIENQKINLRAIKMREATIVAFKPERFSSQVKMITGQFPDRLYDNFVNEASPSKKFMDIYIEHQDPETKQQLLMVKKIASNLYREKEFMLYAANKLTTAHEDTGSALWVALMQSLQSYGMNDVSLFDSGTYKLFKIFDNMNAYLSTHTGLKLSFSLENYRNKFYAMIDDPRLADFKDDIMYAITHDHQGQADSILNRAVFLLADDFAEARTRIQLELDELGKEFDYIFTDSETRFRGTEYDPEIDRQTTNRYTGLAPDLSATSFRTGKTILWTLKDTEADHPNVIVIKCTDEADMLKKYYAYLEDNHIKGIIGHNVKGYDIPFLNERYTVNKLKNPFELEKFQDDNIYDSLDIARSNNGVHQLNMEEKQTISELLTFYLHMKRSTGQGKMQSLGIADLKDVMLSLKSKFDTAIDGENAIFTTINRPGSGDTEYEMVNGHAMTEEGIEVGGDEILEPAVARALSDTCYGPAEQALKNLVDGWEEYYNSFANGLGGLFTDPATNDDVRALDIFKSDMRYIVNENIRADILDVLTDEERAIYLNAKHFRENGLVEAIQDKVRVAFLEKYFPEQADARNMQDLLEGTDINYKVVYSYEDSELFNLSDDQMYMPEMLEEVHYQSKKIRDLANRAIKNVENFYKIGIANRDGKVVRNKADLIENLRETVGELSNEDLKTMLPHTNSFRNVDGNIEDTRLFPENWMKLLNISESLSDEELIAMWYVINSVPELKKYGTVNPKLYLVERTIFQSGLWNSIDDFTQMRLPEEAFLNSTIWEDLSLLERNERVQARINPAYGAKQIAVTGILKDVKRFATKFVNMSLPEKQRYMEDFRNLQNYVSQITDIKILDSIQEDPKFFMNHILHNHGYLYVNRILPDNVSDQLKQSTTDFIGYVLGNKDAIEKDLMLKVYVEGNYLLLSTGETPRIGDGYVRFKGINYYDADYDLPTYELRHIPGVTDTIPDEDLALFNRIRLELANSGQAFKNKGHIGTLDNYKAFWEGLDSDAQKILPPIDMDSRADYYKTLRFEYNQIGYGYDSLSPVHNLLSNYHHYLNTLTDNDLFTKYMVTDTGIPLGDPDFFKGISKSEIIDYLNNNGEMVPVRLIQADNIQGKKVELVKVNMDNYDDLVQNANVKLVPYQVASQMFDAINNAPEASKTLNKIRKLPRIGLAAYKIGYIGLNTYGVVRNLFDSNLKAMLDTGDPMGIIYNNFLANHLYNKYERGLKFFDKWLEDTDLHYTKSTKGYKEFFKTEAFRKLGITEDQFLLVDGFKKNGPSSGEVPYLVDQLNKAILSDPNTPLLTNTVGEASILGTAYNAVTNKLTWGMNWVESRARLAEYLTLLEHGYTKSKAFHQVSKTAFDYSIKSDFVRTMEYAIPFYNFQRLNFLYWMESLEKNPIALDYLLNYYKATVNTYDLNREDLDRYERTSRLYQLLSGNPMISDTGLTFKMQSSFMDAANIIKDYADIAGSTKNSLGQGLYKMMTRDNMFQLWKSGITSAQAAGLIGGIVTGKPTAEQVKNTLRLICSDPTNLPYYGAIYPRWLKYEETDDGKEVNSSIRNYTRLKDYPTQAWLARLNPGGFSAVLNYQDNAWDSTFPSKEVNEDLYYQYGEAYIGSKEHRDLVNKLAEGRRGPALFGNRELTDWLDAFQNFDNSQSDAQRYLYDRLTNEWAPYSSQAQWLYFKTKREAENDPWRQTPEYQEYEALTKSLPAIWPTNVEDERMMFNTQERIRELNPYWPYASKFEYDYYAKLEKEFVSSAPLEPISEAEFNRSTAMQVKYHDYHTYVTGGLKWYSSYAQMKSIEHKKSPLYPYYSEKQRDYFQSLNNQYEDPWFGSKAYHEYKTLESLMDYIVPKHEDGSFYTKEETEKRVALWNKLKELNPYFPYNSAAEKAIYENKIEKYNQFRGPYPYKSRKHQNFIEWTRQPYWPYSSQKQKDYFEGKYSRANYNYYPRTPWIRKGIDLEYRRRYHIHARRRMRTDLHSYFVRGLF